MDKLNLKDKKILYELEKNARVTISDIAKKVGLSKQLVSYKIKRLEEKRIIEGYHAIIDTSRLGYTTYRVYLKFQHLTTQKKDEIFDYLAAINEITILLTIDGRWDAGFAVMVKGIYEFYEIWDKIMVYKEFIDSYHISIYSPIYHFTRTFLSPKRDEIPKTLILGGNEKVKFDTLDIQIIKELAPNIRKPLIEIASKLQKSLQFVINRLKTLEKKGIIQGYRPILNWHLLGYDYYKVDITLRSYKNYKELFEYCKNHLYIFQIDKTIGTTDFEIEIYARSKEHFKEIMQELQDKFNTSLKNYTYFTLGKTYKETFFPT